jgi:UPF0271 protein
MKESSSCHINCDMGESYGPYSLIDDERLMPYIHAANIACGYHAGDPVSMSKTVQLAIKHNIEIGAHPGYPDLQGFGRRNMDIDPETLKSMMLYQIGALRAIVESHSGELHHVKAHGALYNHASKDRNTAYAIANAIKELSGEITLFVPPNSELWNAAISLNLSFKIEAFIDRKYNNDLSLASRKIEGSVIHDPKQAQQQLSLLRSKNKVVTIDGLEKNIKADTYCIHGDNPQSLDILKLIHISLNHD